MKRLGMGPGNGTMWCFPSSYPFDTNSTTSEPIQWPYRHGMPGLLVTRPVYSSVDVMNQPRIR